MALEIDLFEIEVVNFSELKIYHKPVYHVFVSIYTDTNSCVYLCGIKIPLLLCFLSLADIRGPLVSPPLPFSLRSFPISDGLVVPPVHPRRRPSPGRVLGSSEEKNTLILTR